MKGIHAILQEQCPVCYYSFLPDTIIIMRVVERVNRENSKPWGVMVEYIHEWCAPPSERKKVS